jgi:hypothetical protein
MSLRKSPLSKRSAIRSQCVGEINISYEGIKEHIRVLPPNLSVTGMFISTTRIFPEGAVLNLSFRLSQTGVDIRTRSEVRHCIPGVGVGVEFIDISADAADNIATEIAMHMGKRPLAPKKRQTPD